MFKEMNMIIIAPVVMILLGAFIKLKGLKFKSIWGFRTNLSMENENNWKTAQSIFSKWSIILGFIELIYVLVIQYLEGASIVAETTAYYLRLISLIVLVLLFVLTEQELKKTLNINN